MELTGVIVGVFPLMLYGLDNYRRVATSFKDYLRYDALLARLQDRLFLQEEHFKTTLTSVGFQGMSLDDIELHLHESHPQKAVRFVSIIKRMETIAKIVKDKLTLSDTLKESQHVEPRTRVLI